jgi:hypothetical protein
MPPARPTYIPPKNEFRCIAIDISSYKLPRTLIMNQIDSVPTALKTTMATDKKTGPEVPPMNIATISAGFEKGDFLVREEQGNRVYFDFFEEVRESRVTQ